MASKLSPQQADAFFLPKRHGNSWKTKKFYSSASSSKTKKDIGMGSTGEMMLTYRATNALLTKSGCGAVLTVFCLPEVGSRTLSYSAQIILQVVFCIHKCANINREAIRPKYQHLLILNGGCYIQLCEGIIKCNFYSLIAVAYHIIASYLYQPTLNHPILFSKWPQFPSYI